MTVGDPSFAEWMFLCTFVIGIITIKYFLDWPRTPEDIRKDEEIARIRRQFKREIEQRQVEHEFEIKLLKLEGKEKLEEVKPGSGWQL